MLALEIERFAVECVVHSVYRNDSRLIVLDSEMELRLFTFRETEALYDGVEHSSADDDIIAVKCGLVRFSDAVERQEIFIQYLGSEYIAVKLETVSADVGTVDKESIVLEICIVRLEVNTCRAVVFKNVAAVSAFAADAPHTDYIGIDLRAGRTALTARNTAQGCCRSKYHSRDPHTIPLTFFRCIPRQR